MNKLQKLITDKLVSGKSYRRIEEECGVNHVSLSQYHKGLIPEGKNLAILGRYFGVEYWRLVEAVDTEASSAERPTYAGENRRTKVILRLLVETLLPLSEEEQLAWLLKIRTELKDASQG